MEDVKRLEAFEMLMRRRLEEISKVEKSIMRKCGEDTS